LITIKSTIAHYYGASEQISDTVENRNKSKVISLLYTGVDQLMQQPNCPQPTTASVQAANSWYGGAGKSATTRVNERLLLSIKMLGNKAKPTTLAATT